MNRIYLNEPEPPKPAGNSTEPPKLTVEQVYNHVYFYTEVNTDHVLDMIMKVREVDDTLRSERISRAIPGHPMTPIWLHIQSGGGSLFAGFSAIDQLATIESPVYSVIEGYCASAATLISVGCTKRYILPNAFMLIHQLSSSMWGKYEDFKDEMNMLEMAMDKIVSFYASKTKMSKKKVGKLLKRESWFDAGQCIELGLVDEILTTKRQ